MGDAAKHSTTRREARAAERGAHGRFRSGFTTLRDLMLFVTGIAIIAHEVWFAEQAEAAVIAVGVALTGAPLVLGADERKRS